MNLWSRIGLAAFLSLALVARATAEDKVDLKVGDKAPAFEGKTDEGKTWKSADVVGKKIVVVYFYPGDQTNTCTKQACAYRDDMAKLKDRGVEVIGISGDSVKNHELFKKVQKLNFTLLADEDGAIASKFGVPFTKEEKTVNTVDAEGNKVVLKRPVTIKRWTFVIDKDGKIAARDDKVDGVNDSKHILEVAEKLEKK